MARPSRHDYFMDIADAVSCRATCDRAHVGCVLVLSDRIIATGYNGSPPGLPHCDDVGHDMEDNHCIRTIHAEENAIVQAALHGVSTKSAICYATTRPCVRCTGRLYSAGIRHVIYRDQYSSMSIEDEARLEAFLQRGLVIKHIDELRSGPELQVVRDS